MTGAGEGGAGRAPAWLRLLRPAQWLKNGIVPAAWLFARWDAGQRAAAVGWRPVCLEALAAACFCLLSSAVYVMNDLRDRDADRLHPVKRLRPLAAGEIRPAAARPVSALLFAASLALSWIFFPRAFFAVLAGYAAMQAAYTFFLKRIPYVDVFIIAFGFVLRAVAGAAAITVRISPWLLLCTFLLSLFLALCKRRHERLLADAGPGAAAHREALSGYDARLLDLQIAVTAASTLVCYAIYSLSGETAERFGTRGLGLTIPFVVFGLFRYMDLVYSRGAGGRPEKILLTDRILIATIAGYLLTVLAVFLSLPVK